MQLLKINLEKKRMKLFNVFSIFIVFESLMER